MKYQLQMFWCIAIKPFIVHFGDLAHNLYVKIGVGVLWVVGVLWQSEVWLAEIQTVFGQLLTMPPKLWLGLNILIFLDFTFGTFRALFDEKIHFKFSRWTRTAYKYSAYNGACFVVAILVNMFPEGWTTVMLVQYVVYGLLAGKEVVSALRNLKLISLLEVVWDVVKTGHVDMKKIMEKWEERSEKEYLEHERKFKMMDDNDA